MEIIRGSTKGYRRPMINTTGFLQSLPVLRNLLQSSEQLDAILYKMLLLLDKTFEFKHSMVLLTDENSGDILRVAASYGYDGSGIGAEVKMGDGVIGVVAKRKKLMRQSRLKRKSNYAKRSGTCGLELNNASLSSMPKNALHAVAPSRLIHLPR